MRHVSYYIVIFYSLLLTVVFSTHGNAQELIHREIVESAQRNGIDPALALSIAEVESAFNPNAVGSLGEIGVYQLRPEYHAVFKGHTRDNIEVAMRYLADLKVKCSSYGDAFFVCFNYGPARKLKNPRQFPYYVKVKAAMNRRVISVAKYD